MSALELRVPPLIVAFLAAAAMKLIARWLPGATLDVPFGRVMAVTLAAAGAVVALAGVFTFRRHRTTVHPHRPETASTLVTSGIYRVTRNPMYLGLVLALTGWAVRLGNPLTVIGIASFVWYMGRFQIGPEERALVARFGDDYERYRRSVRRWI